MPKGSVMTEVIRDPKGMNAYGRAAAAPSLAEGGAMVLVADHQPEVLEGEWPATQTIVLEFESVDAARAWYTSDTYQAAATLRHAATDSNAVIVSGFS
jgi:uncharacterized protein (DUF1330 family)